VANVYFFENCIKIPKQKVFEIKKITAGISEAYWAFKRMNGFVHVENWKSPFKIFKYRG
jgi:hypothetical protein